MLGSPELSRARLAADTWCAAFVADKRPAAEPITQDTLVRVLGGGSGALSPGELAVVQLAREAYSFLHWHVAFPAVWERGGFDVVLGNPPWERVKLQEKEFFATRSPEIATAPNKAARDRLIRALADEDPALLTAFEGAKREAEGASHFIRSTGRYPLCGRGDVNTYAVFAELMRAATGPKGRVGVIVPTGIATDDTTKLFFQDVSESRSLASLFDFENRAGLFPTVDSRMKFSLMTLTGPARPVEAGAAFVFFATAPEQLDDPERRFTLSAEDIALLNPNTRTCPVFRSRRDAELTKQIYRRVPVLVREGRSDGNPWGVKFLRMFDMSNDSHLFRTAAQLEADGFHLRGNTFVCAEERWAPLYEAKMADMFDHRAADVVVSATAKIRQGQPQAITDLDHQRPDYLPTPRFWVSDNDVAEALATVGPRSALLAWRRISATTNERTFLVSTLPVVAVGDSLFLFATRRPSYEPGLLVNAGSLVFDYVVRQKMGGTNVSFFITDQLPVLPPESYDQHPAWLGAQSLLSWVSYRALELTFTATDLTPFARELGYQGPPFRWDSDRRALIRAELDAAMFRLYGIERADVEYIMDTFPIVRRKNEQRFGEYRTKRLVLERYDAMVEADATGVEYRSPLDPPPGDARAAGASASPAVS